MFNSSSLNKPLNDQLLKPNVKFSLSRSSSSAEIDYEVKVTAMLIRIINCDVSHTVDAVSADFQCW